MLTVEPDAVTGVTGDCDGFVTIVVFVVTTVGGMVGGTGGGTSRGPGRGMSEGGAVVDKGGTGKHWLSVNNLISDGLCN